MESYPKKKVAANTNRTVLLLGETATRWWKDETDFLAYLREELDKMESRECSDADLSRTLEKLSGGKYDNWWIFTDINGYRVETCPFEA